MESIKHQDVIELPVIEDVQDLETLRTIEEEVTDSLQRFTYQVDRSGSNLVVTFNQFSSIRHHTSRLYYPYIDYSRPKGHQSIVKPNQWLEAKIRGRWVLLGDADNR